MTTMKTKIVSIGNSTGIRLPASLIKQYGIEEDVELEPKEDCIVIRPQFKVREGWEKSFDKMRTSEDDVLLDEEVELSKAWDESEWVW